MDFSWQEEHQQPIILINRWLSDSLIFLRAGKPQHYLGWRGYLQRVVGDFGPSPPLKLYFGFKARGSFGVDTLTSGVLTFSRHPWM